MSQDRYSEIAGDLKWAIKAEYWNYDGYAVVKGDATSLHERRIDKLTYCTELQEDGKDFSCNP